MREMSTKPYEVGEHVMIDGVEYVVGNENKAGRCNGCIFKDTNCSYIPCDNIVFKKFEPEPRLMTNRELAEWLAKGNGQLKYTVDDSNTMAVARFNYNLTDEDNDVSPIIRIRPWGNDEWIKPTYDIYEKDCK